MQHFRPSRGGAPEGRRDRRMGGIAYAITMNHRTTGLKAIPYILGLLLLCAAGNAAAPADGPGRGFPNPAPWMSRYGSATKIGDLSKVAARFRIINIAADPGTHGFTPVQIAQLKAGGKNRVVSYLDIGSCENFRTYWKTASPDFVSGSANTAAHLGPYGGYPNET